MYEMVSEEGVAAEQRSDIDRGCELGGADREIAMEWLAPALPASSARCTA